MKKFLLAIFAFAFAFTACNNAVQQKVADEQTELLVWSHKVEKAEGDNEYRVIFTGKIKSGYHTYTLNDFFSPTEFSAVEVAGGELVGEPYELGTPTEVIDEFGDLVQHYDKEIILAQNIKVDGEGAKYTGKIHTNTCTGGACSNGTYKFEVIIGSYVETATPAVESASEETVEATETDATVETPADNTAESGVKRVESLLTNPKAKITAESKAKESIWSQILTAILWGFIMLLTPCVFPMVPMTVSFFLKGSGSVAEGRFKALMYGVFIVLIYTVPIAILLISTRLFGGDAVTANIFNWISTHWIPNLLFFVIFMVFAASFFGAFEITLPQSIVNKSDQNSDKKGLAGVFFMALTLVLVSFSCTGPIVGSVLIDATSSGGSFMTPIIVMLAFSTAFAIPFTIFAFSPTLLKKFKKSGGGWLNSVKVVLGFIEIALGLKFLSVADQTYHWGILDREIYLAIWIAVFTLLGLYLLGKIRFAHDEPLEHLSVPRLSLAIVVFAFVAYLIPGMWGAPLKGIAGYLPPMSTHDFIVNLDPEDELEIYKDFEEGLKAAEEQNKPIFIDVTGHGCVNCREMELRVWTDPEVKSLMKEYVIVALYVDDRADLPKSKWITNLETKEVYNTVGEANDYIANTLYNTSTQPTYVLLQPNGEILIDEIKNYDLDIRNFATFLEKGLKKFEKK